jgi:hypothetical protein
LNPEPKRAQAKTAAQHDQKVALCGGFLFGFNAGEARFRSAF